MKRVWSPTVRSFRVMSVVCSVVISLLVLEMGLRVFWLKRVFIGAGIEHPHFHHRLKPNDTYHFTSGEFDVTLVTNRYGLRGPPPVVPKPDGVIRLLMLGDSFIFGFTVEDEQTFCRVVERDLRARGYPIEVINGGVSGYSPTLHYVSLRDQFLAFEPDLIVLWYDFGDLQEDRWFEKNLIYDEGGRIVRCDPRYLNGRFNRSEWLKNHSALAKYFDRKLWSTLSKIRALGLGGYARAKLRGERAKAAIARLKAEQHAEDLPEYDRFLLARDSSTVEELRSYWTPSRRLLLMIRDLVAERGIPFILGVYPYGMQAGPDQWARGRVFWGFEPGRTYDSTAALALFREFSSDAHIPLVNAFESFREAARSEKLFFDQDCHMTAAGQRVLATHLVQDPQFVGLLNGVLARAQRDPVGPMARTEAASPLPPHSGAAVKAKVARPIPRGL